MGYVETVPFYEILKSKDDTSKIQFAQTPARKILSVYCKLQVKP
jgi:hypothetical protein